MRWIKVPQLPARVVLLLMVASVLATVVAFRPWDSGEAEEAGVEYALLFYAQGLCCFFG
jgi:hypothetical protein